MADAVGRLRIEKAAGSPWPASVGSLEVWPSIPGSEVSGLFTVEGAPVGVQTYWSGGDGPTKLWFNTSDGQTAYYVYLGKGSPGSAPAWKPEAGLLVETRTVINQPVDNWGQLRRALSSATAPTGRSLVPNIFLGINPHGSSTDFVALFSGYFQVAKAGGYSFATASSDASYLSVDGKVIADWLGRHGPWDGTRGQHAGNVELSAGKHRLEYGLVHFQGAPTAVAAWKPPGQARFEVIPPAAFLPVGQFKAVAFEAGSAGADKPYLEWDIAEHSLVAGLGVFRASFRVLSSVRSATYRWVFDDGAVERGVAVQHFFLRPGPRQVTLEAYQGKTRTARVTAAFRVHPQWSQREEWHQGLYEQARQSFLARDLSGLNANDLLAIVELADRLEDRDLMNRTGDCFLKRQAEFNSAPYAGIYYGLGLNFQGQADRGDTLAEQAWRLALGLSASNPAIKEKTKLRLAALLINHGDKLEEAASLLNPVPAGVLTEDEKRLARLLWGDLYAAQGKLAEARKIYLGVGDKLDKPGGNSEVRHDAKLESANISLHRGELETAEQILDQLRLETPQERLSLEVNLPLVEVYLARKQYRQALAACLRLPPLGTGDARESLLLWDTAEAGFASGRRPEAQAALLKLLHNYPYSEEAARAKDRWGAPASRK